MYALQKLPSKFARNQIRATGYINRSRAYNDKDQFDAALNDCRTALRLSPGNPYALKQRGYAYMGKQQLDSSKIDLSKVLQLLPRDTIAWYWRGLVNYFCFNQITPLP